MRTIEYHTALFQQGRITHVDGRWIGTRAPTDPQAVDTCPDLHVYLSRVGGEGWELCGQVPIAQGQATQLVFKRA